MLDNFFNPIVLCFIVGIIAGLSKSDLRFPEALYETLSIFLLFTIGLKGGVKLAESNIGELVAPALGTIFLGVFIPIIAYIILLFLKFSKVNSAAIAAHYGSVSAVTFAIVLEYLTARQVSYNEYVTVLLVLLEIPAIIVGIIMARLAHTSGTVNWKGILHEVFFGKSIFLLIAGLLVGCIAGPDRMTKVEPLFFDLFSGALMLFLLEMGIVASHRIADLRKAGLVLVLFAICMPLLSGFIGAIVGQLTGLSVGGVTVLSTLAASSSYIAAPAAMRIAVPQANPTYYLTASLGITFPFNIVIGIPIYYQFAQWVSSFGG